MHLFDLLIFTPIRPTQAMRRDVTAVFTFAYFVQKPVLNLVLVLHIFSN
jgi:hypothetical protein